MDKLTHIPRKRFGQHFLSDQAVIHQIVELLNPSMQDHLVEIGPGQGALTVPVLKKVKSLEAIELDRDLIHELERRTHRLGQLKIYVQDALLFDYAQLKKDSRLLRVFGNLPYNISTPLIFHLLQYRNIIADLFFMLQKEVAMRIAAKPGSKNYGRLSVMVQYYCKIELLMEISPRAFYPPPQVRSSMIKLTPYQKCPDQALDDETLAMVVRQAFGQRRKTLRNSLKDIVSDDLWATIDLHSDLRPEDLSVKDFVAIANALTPVLECAKRNEGSTKKKR